VDDMAGACVFLMENYDGKDFVNVGIGEDISISDLANLIAQIVGFEGSLKFDRSKPDGTPRKLMDVSRINQLGWTAQIHLEKGIKMVYEDFKASLVKA
jgi:GDP-L-fucose synthase